VGLGVEVGVDVDVDVGVGVRVDVGVGVMVGPNNCPGPQAVMRKLNREQTTRVRNAFFMESSLSGIWVEWHAICHLLHKNQLRKYVTWIGLLGFLGFLYLDFNRDEWSLASL
jgi:hypothetical protein